MLRKWSCLAAVVSLLFAVGCGGGADQPGGPHGGVDTLGISYIQAQHQGFLLIRPKQIIESPVVRSLLEVIPEGEDPFGEMREDLGIDPRTVETVVLIGGGKPEAIRSAAEDVARGGVPSTKQEDISGCIVIHATVPIEEELKNHPGLKNHQQAKHGSATYLKSPDDSAPSLYFIDPQTVLLASDHEIGNFIDHPAASGPLHELVAKADLDHDIVGLGVMGELSKLVENPPEGVAVPAAGKGLLDAAQNIRSGNLVIDVGSAPSLQTQATFNEASSAEKFQKLLSGYIEFGKAAAMIALPDMQFPDGVDKDAVVALLMETVQSLALKQEGTNVTLSAATPKDFHARLEKILPGLVAASHSAARDAAALNKLRQITLAMHIYDNRHDHFPADIVAEDGTPLMSWRVELLPYLDDGYGDVYKQLRRNEPWDSEHNAKLLAQMPDVFALGVPADGKTDALAPAGNGAWGGRDQPLKLTEVRDGASNTVALVQVQPDRAVPWAKPGDYAFDPDDPAAGLGASADAEEVLVVLMDVSGRSVPKSLSAQQWKALFTCDGGEVVDFLFHVPGRAAPAAVPEPNVFQGID